MAAETVPLPHSLASNPTSDRLHDFPVTVPRSRCFKNVYANNFLSDTAELF